MQTPENAAIPIAKGGESSSGEEEGMEEDETPEQQQRHQQQRRKQLRPALPPSAYRRQTCFFQHLASALKPGARAVCTAQCLLIHSLRAPEEISCERRCVIVREDIGCARIVHAHVMHLHVYKCIFLHTAGFAKRVCVYMYIYLHIDTYKCVHACAFSIRTDMTANVYIYICICLNIREGIHILSMRIFLCVITRLLVCIYTDV